MSAQLLNGNDLAKTRKAELKANVATFQQAHGVTPTLAILRLSAMMKPRLAMPVRSNAIVKALTWRSKPSCYPLTLTQAR